MTPDLCATALTTAAHHIATTHHYPLANHPGTLRAAHWLTPFTWQSHLPRHWATPCRTTPQELANQLTSALQSALPNATITPTADGNITFHHPEHPAENAITTLGDYLQTHPPTTPAITEPPLTYLHHRIKSATTAPDIHHPHNPAVRILQAHQRAHLHASGTTAPTLIPAELYPLALHLADYPLTVDAATRQPQKPHLLNYLQTLETQYRPWSQRRSSNLTTDQQHAAHLTTSVLTHALASLGITTTERI